MDAACAAARSAAAEPARYERFQLVLMVTHACNLRCDYCYVGCKSPRSMNLALGLAAIRRAVRSLAHGGVLELGFFGGEPLLEAELVAELIGSARQIAAAADVGLQLQFTTNGTVLTAPAWQVMMLPDLELAVSHDGLPEVHDRHRLQKVAAAPRKCSTRSTSSGRRPRSPGRHGRAAGQRRTPERRHCVVAGAKPAADRPALDVWARWTPEDAGRLENALVRTADLWLAGLPGRAINWFDEKAARLLGLPIEATARCRFGDGQVAVSPAGNLYPCERLIGEDAADSPLRLPGHALEGDDFRGVTIPGRSAAACGACAIATQCNTTCRCNNFVRTGDVGRPDALLCLVERVCYREAARVLAKARWAGLALAQVKEQRHGKRRECFAA